MEHQNDPRQWGVGLPEPGMVKPVNNAFRIAWIIWCVLWGTFWITAGWLLLPLVNVVLCVVSFVLIYAVPNSSGGNR